MNRGMPTRPHVSLLLPAEEISGRAVITDPKPKSSLPQGSPILDEESSSSWSLNVPTYSYNHQVDAEAHTVGVYLSSQSIICQRSIDEGACMSYLENRIVGVNDGDFPAACLSDPEFMCQRAPDFPESNMSPRSTMYQECMPIHSLFDHDHRYTHAHTTFDSPVSSTLSAGIYTTPTVAKHRDQRASREVPQRSKKSEEGSAAESPSTPLQSNWKRGDPPRRYRCTCGRDYAQPQGLTRHRRETHDACICMYCGAFAWARPYRFREHVRRMHPEVDPDVALEKATYLKTRRSVTIKTKNLPQCTSRFVEERMYPLSSPPAVMGVRPTSLPALSSVGYDLQLGSAESAESTMGICIYEDARDMSESFGAYYAHSTFPPSK